MEEVFFRFSGGQVGGIVAEGFDNEKDAKKDTHPRYTVTLKEIFERFNAPKVIDYLSLDVEGAEGFIMEDFPLTDYKVSIMTIERPKESLRELLGRKGYKHLKDLSGWGETLWAHESIVDSLDLSYLDTLV
ncbi:methyltransferase [Fragilaria crotonensis]|nr:methyltransferase [Fragilaria crotonensis]